MPAVLNRNLKVAIINAGLRQFEVAQKAGIHESRFSNIANQRGVPTDAEKKEIATVLGVAVGDIFQKGKTDEPAGCC